MTRLGRGRRWGAIVLFRLASAILRGATALYRRRVISGADLRTALSMARCVERAGARVVLGSTSQPAFIKTRDEDNGGLD
ncbi:MULTISPECIES: hypothetical protein [unclassified Bradyrhizobium]|uniref:hypothetical protein n=1 Tax=unclassified Bradyrhizobium TaxID=2631580 RepID=UPI001BA8AC8E|nr:MULTISPECIES: hypothetical protein [unclassified Bradyrhizobium]MBR1204845.1 hypothetical protein [Bradyrhizobium sp. AUGA SZCCT0124]MBR1311931.1 hypothetical protein [Bradyrhizobium sp. AUGA SZCCT0051]MBR1343661.1 hypothetical protein [Bradyrhizobium sp. AUGA SZCCT0105]MBR1358202.1 hypothetical protein [Bradyrhizobium sp. AUGA SZCCT0045]